MTNRLLADPPAFPDFLGSGNASSSGGCGVASDPVPSPTRDFMEVAGAYRRASRAVVVRAHAPAVQLSSGTPLRGRSPDPGRLRLLSRRRGVDRAAVLHV